MLESARPNKVAVVGRRAALRLLFVGSSSALLAACSPPAPSAAPLTPTSPSTQPVPTRVTDGQSGPAQPATAQATGASVLAGPVPEQPKRGGQLTTSTLPLARLDAHWFLRR